jgi:hypothetical protein
VILISSAYYIWLTIIDHEIEGSLTAGGYVVGAAFG